MTTPLASIVIPTRHRLKLLQRAIDSVANQTYSNIELVIVDNAADTPLRQTDVRYDGQLKIVRTTQMLPLPSSRNFGAEHATGEFISFLDDDDELLPEKLSSHIDVFNNCPDTSYVYGKTRQIGPNGETIAVCQGTNDIVSFLSAHHIHTNALTLRRRVLDVMQYSPDMSTYEDVEFNGRLLQQFQGHYIPEIHAVWYRDNRPDQITQRNYRRAYENWQRICDRFDDIITGDRFLRKKYHRKMAILSLLFLDLNQALRSAKKLL